MRAFYRTNTISEHAPDEALRWLLSRIRAPPPAGLGLQANVKAHESSKRTAFYISSPCSVYVSRSSNCLRKRDINVSSLKLDCSKQRKKPDFLRDCVRIWVEL